MWAALCAWLVGCSAAPPVPATAERAAPAPVTIDVTRNDIRLNGVVVGSTRALAGQPPHRVINDLVDGMKQIVPRAAAPYRLTIHPDAPIEVWSSVVRAAASAGHTFGMVDGIMFEHSPTKTSSWWRVVMLQQQGKKRWLRRYEGKKLVREVEVPVLEDLASALKSLCADPPDRCYQQAALWVDDAATFAQMSAVAHALQMVTQGPVGWHVGPESPERWLTASARLPPAVIRGTVRAHHGAMRGCYEDGLRRNRSMRGHLLMRFVIQPDGTVGSFQRRVAAGDIDAVVAECVGDVVRGIRFPLPDGGDVGVFYPVQFNPRER
jgi:hypothetical protein